MKKITCIITLIGIISLVFVGCAKKDDGSSTSTSSDTDTDTQVEVRTLLAKLTASTLQIPRILKICLGLLLWIMASILIVVLIFNKAICINDLNYLALLTESCGQKRVELTLAVVVGKVFVSDVDSPSSC